MFYVKHVHFMDIGHKTHKYKCFIYIIFISNRCLVLFQKICLNVQKIYIELPMMNLSLNVVFFKWTNESNLVILWKENALPEIKKKSYVRQQIEISCAFWIIFCRFENHLHFLGKIILRSLIWCYRNFLHTNSQIMNIDRLYIKLKIMY